MPPDVTAEDRDAADAQTERGGKKLPHKTRPAEQAVSVRRIPAIPLCRQGDFLGMGNVFRAWRSDSSQGITKTRPEIILPRTDRW